MTCTGMNRGKCRQPVGVSPHTFGIKAILHPTCFRPLPIPAQQHRSCHTALVHRPQQFIYIGEGLHSLAILPPSRAKFRPMFLPARRGPRRRVTVHLRRVEMHMTVDDRHGADSHSACPPGKPGTSVTALAATSSRATHSIFPAARRSSRGCRFVAATRRE